MKTPHARTAPAPTTSARRRTRAADAVSRSALLEAASLGGEVARADLAADPAGAGVAFAAWRRLRRRTGRQSRQLLRVAFDTGYGQAMSPWAEAAATRR